MTTLVSTPALKRAHCGFDHYLNFDECNQLQESGTLVVDCAFHSFEKATNDQLALPFALLGGLGTMPETIGLCISYSRKNAAVMKGYLLDVVDAYKAAGYEHFTSVHVPYEAHGTPMVGSVLMLVFSKKPFAYVPEKKTVLPADAFPGLRYHAPNGRSSGSVYPGTALMNGFLHSNKSFLPEFNVWAGGTLRCEYQKDDYTEAEALRRVHIQQLFGVAEYDNPDDLRLCTPPSVLQTILAIKPLAEPGAQPT